MTAVDVRVQIAPSGGGLFEVRLIGPGGWRTTHHGDLSSCRSDARATAQVLRIEFEDVPDSEPQHPPAPWPVGRDNAKREGWKCHFEGRPRSNCPFPTSRRDLLIGYREGWDAAAATRKHPNDAPMYAADGTLLDDQGNRSIFDDVDL